MGVNALEVRRRVMMAQPHEAVASGAVASFRTDVVSGLPLEFDLLPIQSGTGDPSPENKRPITGHDGFTVYDDPKYGGNIWWNQLVKISVSDTSKEQNNVRIVDNRDGSYTISTNGAASAATYIGGPKIGVNVGHKYYYRSGVPIGASSNWRSYVISVGSITAVKEMTKGAIYRADASVTANFVPVYVANGATISTPITIYPIMVDMTEAFGSELTEEILAMTAEQAEAWFDNLFPLDYYAYNAGTQETVSEVNGNTIPKRSTTFPTPPGTVYGGHVTDNGDGTWDIAVDGVNVTFDGSIDEDWQNSASSSQVSMFTLNLGNFGLVVDNSGICDKLPSVTNISASNTVVGIRVFNSAGYNKSRVAVRPSWAVVGSTVSDLKTWLAENPLQVVYKLSNPIVYTNLPLTAIQSLIGQNNIWVDNADEVSVEYWGH